MEGGFSFDLPLLWSLSRLRPNWLAGRALYVHQSIMANERRVTEELFDRPEWTDGGLDLI
jgi:hypothetical protein